MRSHWLHRSAYQSSFAETMAFVKKFNSNTSAPLHTAVEASKKSTSSSTSIALRMYSCDRNKLPFQKFWFYVKNILFTTWFHSTNDLNLTRCFLSSLRYEFTLNLVFSLLFTFQLYWIPYRAIFHSTFDICEYVNIDIRVQRTRNECIKRTCSVLSAHVIWSKQNTLCGINPSSHTAPMLSLKRYV